MSANATAPHAHGRGNPSSAIPRIPSRTCTARCGNAAQNGGYQPLPARWRRGVQAGDAESEAAHEHAHGAAALGPATLAVQRAAAEPAGVHMQQWRRQTTQRQRDNVAAKQLAAAGVARKLRVACAGVGAEEEEAGLKPLMV